MPDYRRLAHGFGPKRPPKHATSRTTQAGYVYLLRSHQRSPIANTRLYKTGCSRKPSARFRALSTGPSEITLAALVPTWDMYGLEGRLHERFDHRRVNGEWFALSERDITIFNTVTAKTVTKRSETENEQAPQPIRLIKRVR